LVEPCASIKGAGMEKSKENKKIFYGWWIVVGGFILNFCGIGIVINCSSVFFKPVVDSLGFSRGDLSLYFTIASLSMMAGAPFVGKLMEKFDVRIIMGICTTVTAVSVVLFSQCRTLPQFYLVAFFMGIGSAGSHLIPVSAMVTNWFKEKQGLAMGIVFAASALGGAVASPLTDWMILQYGWQTSYIITGIFVGVITIPISILMMRNRPEDMGLHPYGKVLDQAAADEGPAGLTVMGYLKQGSFWLLAISFFLIGVICLGIQQHVVPYLIDLGYGSTFAAYILTLYMGVLVPGKIALGALCDKVGVRKSFILILIVMVATALCLFGAKAMWMVIVFAVLFGIANGVQTVVLPLMTSAYVGTVRFAVMYGVMNIFITLGSGIGMPLSGYIYDFSGSYFPAWWLYIGLTFVAGILGFVALRKARAK
jgi:MFS family permease